MIMVRSSLIGLKQAPDFALDGADDVCQRLLSIDAYNAGARKGEAPQIRDAFSDERGSHVRLAPRRGFREDLELDDEIGRKTACGGIGGGLESARPTRGPAP